MKDDRKAARQIEIETAAYALLAEKGFAGTTMLSIARRARCSNETMYNWYGDKLGLMQAMVARNAEVARKVLTEAQQDAPPLETLRVFGAVLLGVLQGERPVLLNRAAAADGSGELGQALAAAGRESIAPLLSALFARAFDEAALTRREGLDPVEIYLGLLIGDLQIRRVIARAPMLSDAEMTSRAHRAVDLMEELFS